MNNLPITRRVNLIIQIVGFCVFVVAFFLPAVRAASSQQNTFVGWECAKLAFMGTFTADSYKSYDLLEVISGWLNPFMLLYLTFSFSRRFVVVRRILAVAIVICMIATWIVFMLANLVPLIGHYLWIAGALMMLTPEVMRISAEKLSTDIKPE